MSFAEIVLRIGTSIAGWLIFIALGLTLAVIPDATCDPGSDEIWRGTLLFGLLSGLSLLFVGRGLPWRESIRWLSVPAMGLAVYAAFGILPAVVGTTLGGESLCAIADSTASAAELAAIEATGIERIWPILQLSVLAIGTMQGVRYWTGPTERPDDA